MQQARLITVSVEEVRQLLAMARQNPLKLALDGGVLNTGNLKAQPVIPEERTPIVGPAILLGAQADIVVVTKAITGISLTMQPGEPLPESRHQCGRRRAGVDSG